jgi:hypothetical protein
MAEPMHLGHPTGVDRKQTWRRITAAAIQHVAEQGYINVTMKPIAGVPSAAVHEYITGEHLAQQRSGDSSGRLEGAPNVWQQLSDSLRR